MCLLPSPFGWCHKWWKPHGVSSCGQGEFLGRERGVDERQEARREGGMMASSSFSGLLCTRCRRLSAPSCAPQGQYSPLTWGHPAGQGAGSRVWVAPVFAGDIAGHDSVIKPRELCAQNTRAFSITDCSHWIRYPDAVCVCVCVCVFLHGIEIWLFFFFFLKSICPVVCRMLVPRPRIELHVPSIRIVGS